MSDTIYALATAPGKAGVCVIRISGPDAFSLLAELGVDAVPLRKASLRILRDGDGSVLDHGLVLTFSARASFTGEDIVELQLHGSIAVQRAVMRRLGETGLGRLAEPGEFTKRALLNGRLDLTEVQGLADVIEAETEIQRRAAMRVMGGGMSDRIASWRVKLVRAAALLEAVIDFADEDVPVDVMPEVRDLVEGVIAEMRPELEGMAAARSLREGFEVAIVGAPNAGKSSLLNALVRSNAAIVSDIPGTTRDTIERAIDLDGMKVIFIDTAGLRDTDDEIERLGVDLAVARGTEANLRIFLYEEAEPPSFPIRPREGDIVIRSKADLHGGNGLSSHTGEGLTSLLTDVSTRLAKEVSAAGFITRETDARALRSGIEALTFVMHTMYDRDVEFIVADLRTAIGILERIVGQVGVEDVLDEIFKSFCLGK